MIFVGMVLFEFVLKKSANQGFWHVFILLVFGEKA